jgi:signal transduction histidine kinase
MIRTNNPIKMLSITIILTIFILGGISLVVWDSFESLDNIQVQALRMDGLIGNITYYDEILTMSATMAAETGDQRWEARYRSVEMILDSDIKEVIRTSIGGNIDENAKRVDEANIKLVEMENRVFDLVRAQRKEEGKAILESKEYTIQKRIYSEGLKEIILESREYIKAVYSAQRQRVFIVMLAIITSIILLVFSWFIVLNTIRKYIEEDKKTNDKIIESRDQLAILSKTKSEFLANMSHELRTPLNSIIGFSEIMLIKIGGELNEKQTSYVNNIVISSNFLLNLINDILDLSKIEAGKVELVKEKLSVPTAIEEIHSLIKEKAANQNIELRRELEPELEYIEADHMRFKQILFNLLNNAIKFSKKGGTVTITSKKGGDMARFSISDTGIGIKEENLGKLFKEFGQADTEISRKYGGTGLGLAITKKLVELHGGKIWVESKYGEGSTFIFTLPLKASFVNTNFI